MRHFEAQHAIEKAPSELQQVSVLKWLFKSCKSAAMI